MKDRINQDDSACRDKSRPKRICMLSYSFYENDNRVIRYAETLARDGDLVDVVTLGHKGEERRSVLRGVSIYKIQYRIKDEDSPLTYLRRIFTFILKATIFLGFMQVWKRYDVLHVHSVPDFLVFAGLAPKLMGAKIVLDIHDLLPEFYDSKFKCGSGSLVFRSLRLVEKLSAKFADHVIASNHIWEKTLQSRSVPCHKCSVIMNYPDGELFFKRPREKTPGKFVFLYPGYLGPHQGVDVAIRAMRHLREVAPEVVLHIYGEGPQTGYLKNLVTENQLEDRVLIRDAVPFRSVPELMACADAGLVPKRNDCFAGTAFSTKILEFMSMGVPVLISRTKIDTYYFDETMVKFFEPEDDVDLAEAMLDLAADESIRKKLSENGLECARRYCWSSNKHVYHSLLDSMTGHD